jgi:HEAT repeat protein
VSVKRGLEDLRRWRTRGEAVRSLIKAGRIAVPGLLDVLYDMNLANRLEAVIALGRIGDPSAINGLVGTLLYDDHMMVRQESAKALARIRHSVAIPSLLDALTDEEVWVRRDVTLALGHLGALHGDRAERIVRALLLHAVDQFQVRLAALDALDRIGEAGIPALVEGLHHPGWVTRHFAAEGLIRQGTAAFPVLIELAQKSGGGTRRMASWALERLPIHTG